MSHGVTIAIQVHGVVSSRRLRPAARRQTSKRVGTLGPRLQGAPKPRASPCTRCPASRQTTVRRVHAESNSARIIQFASLVRRVTNTGIPTCRLNEVRLACQEILHRVRLAHGRPFPVSVQSVWNHHDAILNFSEKGRGAGKAAFWHASWAAGVNKDCEQLSRCRPSHVGKREGAQESAVAIDFDDSVEVYAHLATTLGFSLQAGNRHRWTA